MRTILIVSITAINIFAIVLNFKMLKGQKNTNITTYLAVQEVVLLIIGKIIFNIATIGIDAAVSSTSQNMILFLFQGMNMIIISAPLAKIFASSKDEKNEKRKESFFNKLIIWVIITIILIIGECIYIKNIENGILSMKK